MTDLQTIRDLRAGATPGPHSVDVIDDHAGTKTWLICDLARERYGNNSVSFGEDEGTARFVAAAFTVVPEMAARLQRVEELLADMDSVIESGVESRVFKLAADGLRNALGLEPR